VKVTKNIRTPSSTLCQLIDPKMSVSICSLQFAILDVATSL
jgi:hypothetical protein